MKRAVLPGAVLACLVPVVFAVGAFAATGIHVVNQSKVDIDHLYTSAPGRNAWSPDLLEKTPIDAGTSLTVARLEPGTYDLKIEDDDDGPKPCILKNVAVRAGVSLKITKKMTAACG